jgi:hypothetical protein
MVGSGKQLATLIEVSRRGGSVCPKAGKPGCQPGALEEEVQQVLIVIAKRASGG